jgi:hypothetical protein
MLGEEAVDEVSEVGDEGGRLVRHMRLRRRVIKDVRRTVRVASAKGHQGSDTTDQGDDFM